MKRIILREDDLKAINKILKFLISFAEEWEGIFIGNPDPEPLQNYRKRMKEAKAFHGVIKATLRE